MSSNLSFDVDKESSFDHMSVFVDEYEYRVAILENKKT